MNVRQRKRLIWVLAAGLVACSTGLLAWGVAVPVRVVPTAPAVAVSALADSDTQTDSARARRSAPSRPSLDALQQLAGSNLREPLYDPPPPSAKPTNKREPPEPAPRLTLRLVGTIQEAGHSMAMFQKSDGTIKLCAEGDHVKDGKNAVKVTRVAFRTVTVEHGGRSHELALPRAENGR